MVAFVRGARSDFFRDFCADIEIGALDRLIFKPHFCGAFFDKPIALSHEEIKEIAAIKGTSAARRPAVR